MRGLQDSLKIGVAFRFRAVSFDMATVTGYKPTHDSVGSLVADRALRSAQHLLSLHVRQVEILENNRTAKEEDT